MRPLDYLLFLLNRFSNGRLEDGYKRVPPTLVFVQTRRFSDAAAVFLIREGFRATAINSDHQMSSRLKTVTKMQNGEIDILVATDVLARGVNIPNIATVINVDLPIHNYPSYIHRIGRTGRMGNIGRAISFFDKARDYNMANFLEKASFDI